MMNYSCKFSHYVLSSLSGTCVLLVLLGAITAQGATYVVATTGNDSNPGTLSQPFKSFAQGVSKLQPGDTLYIRGGLYTEQIDLQGPNKSGTANAWITIAGYPGETVTIRYISPVSASYGPIKARGPRGYLIFENLVLDGINDTDETKWQIRDGNHHFILRNLDIKNFHTSTLLVKADYITIQNCKLHDSRSDGTPGTRGYGVYFNMGANGLIEGNEIYNMPGGGIQVYPGPISNVVVRGNRIHDNNTASTVVIGGIIISATSSSTVSNISVYNNIFYNNGSSPNAGSAPGIRVDSFNTTGTKIWNNTIYNNKGYGISINQAVNTVVQNNIVFGNIKGEIADYGAGTILSHNLTTDPKFTKPDVFDFRPQARSLAIDGGVNLVQVTTDFRNVARPKGAAHDIGAYEATESVSPSAPQNLKAQ